MKKILLAVLFFFLLIPVVFADGSSADFPTQPAIALSPSAIPTPTQAQQSQEQYFLGLSNHDLWNIFWGGIVAFILVIMVEWLKTPSAKIELFPHFVHNKRKFLKVKITIYIKPWKKWFMWQNPALVGKLKGQIINKTNGKETILKSFTAKWDANPEPLDYINGTLRVELLPTTSQPQNFLSEDEDSASVIVKHDQDPHFYIYDANYYVDPQKNIINEKDIILRIKFASSSTVAEKDFIVTNSGKTLNSFSMKEDKSLNLQKLLRSLIY